MYAIKAEESNEREIRNTIYGKSGQSQEQKEYVFDNDT